jgi:aspartyl protease family protein
MPRFSAWETRLIWAAFLLATVLALLAVLTMLFPEALGREDAQMRLVHSVLLRALLGGSVILGYRGRARAALKHALAWVLIALALVLAYSFRGEVSMLANRVRGELLPATPIVTAGGAVELRASSDGHFYADALVDGEPVRFMIDTGASMVALAAADARRIGIDPEVLDYDQPVSTANGRTLVARTRLDQIDLGGIHAEGVAATVHEGGLETSLLGMSFLDRLASFERRGDRLILHPR